MEKQSFTKVGTCIFCLRDSTQTHFKERAHTVSRSLGGKYIGKDICDECNHYFGEPDKLVYPHLCIEVCFKEVLALSQILLQEQPKKRLKSRYFNYYQSKGKIEVKPQFRNNHSWLKLFARQFKRGIYEMWLQEYHRYCYGGLNTDFDRIRNFSRFNIGDIPLYYLVNNGCVPVPDKDSLLHPTFNMNEKSLQDARDFGFYSLMIVGHYFILEVSPKADISREVYLDKLSKELRVGGFIFRKIIKLEYITDIDFSYRSLYR